MLVDVIIPAYNPGSFLDKAIQSALGQSCDDINIIVIDDNSTEDVLSVVKKYKKVEYIKNEENMGPSYSRNVGIKASGAPYISFLDADDLWCPNKIKASLAAFDLDDSIGMTCGNYRRIMSAGRLTSPFYSGPISIDLNSLLRINYVASGSVTVKRSIIERAGLFDNRFRVCEDYALWLAISKIAKIHYIDEVLYLYRVIRGGNSITQHPGIKEAMDRNCEIIRSEIYDK